MPEFIALDKVFSTLDCPVQDVGRSLGFTKSGATRIVNRLERKGYVKKVRSHEDGRICCVKITETGKQVLKSADSRYLEQFHDLISRMPGHSLDDIVIVIKDLAKAIRG